MLLPHPLQCHIVGGDCMTKNIDLLNNNIYKLTSKFLLSSVLGTLAVSFYVLFDTIFIGQAVGSNGLAALNICLPIYTLLSAVGLLLGMGGGATFSLALGKKDTHTAHQVFTLSSVLGIIISLSFTALGLLFLEDIALMLGATPDILELVMEYMWYLFAFAPSFIMVHLLTVFVRNNGLPHIAMFSTILSGIVNIILDIIFLFVFDMGMAGAALATCISSVLALTMLTLTILKKPGDLKLKALTLDFTLIKTVFSIGLPTFIVEICSGIVIFLFNIVLLDTLGTVGVSAYGIIANIALMAMAVFNGIGQGIQPLISINHSAKEVDRVRSITRIGFIAALLVGIIFYVVGFFFRDGLVSLFVADDKVLLEVASSAIPYYFIAFLLVGTNLIINYYYQAIGIAKYSIALSLSRGLIFILIGLFILPGILGTLGIWLVVPFAELATLGCIGLFYIFKQKFEVGKTYAVEA